MRITRVRPVQVAKPEPEIDYDLMGPLLSKYAGKAGSLIPLLQGTQEIYGYLPSGAFKRIAGATGKKEADIYGVATFYAQFRLQPVGKNVIRVCHGTACHVQNAPDITQALSDKLDIKSGETTEDMQFTLESVACLGCCSLAPVMMIGEETYGKLDRKSAVRVIREMKQTQDTNGNGRAETKSEKK